MNAPVGVDPKTDATKRPLRAFDMSDPQYYQDDTWYPYFERLRREAPVHFTEDSAYGPYWSISRYKDIMQCEVNHAVFSNEIGGIQVEDQPKDMQRPSFIRMDPPKHDEQRKVVSPIVAPANLNNMEPLIRQRTQYVLDRLPRGETFDWVELVSIELTTMMLATLFDFPFEERRKLTYWSDVAIANVNAPDAPVHSEEERFAELKTMAEYMARLFAERQGQPAQFDLLSMLAHGEATRDMPLREFMGNLALLIVGGNDTTRNSMTGRAAGAEPVPGRVSQADGQSCAGGERRAGDHPLRNAGDPHAAHHHTGHRGGRAAYSGRGEGGDVVRVRQSRRGSGRGAEPADHRPQASAPAPVLWVRHPSLRR